jgi:alpha-glucoside transport system substrate-binding protein
MDWVNGGTSWTDDRIALAWFQWRRDMVTSANSSAALFTGFDAAGKSMFAPRPGCYLDHEGSFIVDNYPHGAADYFQFPTFDGSGSQAMEVSADLAGRFGTSDAARNLMKFLASDDAQRIWPGIPGSGAFSVDRNVGPTVYQDAIARKVAGKLTGTDTLCFDASDLMPDELTGAFYQAVLRYLADPSKLESLLQQLELTSKNVHNGHTTAFQCGLARH